MEPESQISLKMLDVGAIGRNTDVNRKVLLYCDFRRSTDCSTIALKWAELQITLHDAGLESVILI